MLFMILDKRIFFHSILDKTNNFVFQFYSTLFPSCPPRWRSGLRQTSGRTLRWEYPATSLSQHISLMAPAAAASHCPARRSWGCPGACRPRSGWRWSPCGRTAGSSAPAAAGRRSAGGWAPSQQRTPDTVLLRTFKLSATANDIKVRLN